MKTFKDFLKQAQSNKTEEGERIPKNSVIARNATIFKNLK